MIGTWPLSGDYGYVNMHQIIEALDCAYESGFREYDTAPAFQLARNGYDVWLSNSRGSKYGRVHTELDPDSINDQKNFWEFSFVEMGEYDLRS